MDPYAKSLTFCGPNSENPTCSNQTVKSKDPYQIAIKSHSTSKHTILEEPPGQAFPDPEGIAIKKQRLMSLMSFLAAALVWTHYNDGVYNEVTHEDLLPGDVNPKVGRRPRLLRFGHEGDSLNGEGEEQRAQSPGQSHRQLRLSPASIWGRPLEKTNMFPVVIDYL